MNFAILLHQTLYDYMTLFQVYEQVINPDKLRTKIAEGEQRFTARSRRIVVDKCEHLFTDVLSAWSWYDVESGTETWTHRATDIEEVLEDSISFTGLDAYPREVHKA